MQPRKRIGFITLVILGLGIGIFLKNVKIGLIVGLMLGLLAEVSSAAAPKIDCLYLVCLNQFHD